MLCTRRRRRARCRARLWARNLARLCPLSLVGSVFRKNLPRVHRPRHFGRFWQHIGQEPDATALSRLRPSASNPSIRSRHVLRLRRWLHPQRQFRRWTRLHPDVACLRRRDHPQRRARVRDDVGCLWCRRYAQGPFGIRRKLLERRDVACLGRRRYARSRTGISQRCGASQKSESGKSIRFHHNPHRSITSVPIGWFAAASRPWPIESCAFPLRRHGLGVSSPDSPADFRRYGPVTE